MFFLGVIQDALLNPITTIYLLWLLWTSIKVKNKDWNVDSLSISYNSCVKMRKIWRILTACFCQTDTLQLLIILPSIWACRVLETTYGSFFYFRYTCLLILFDAVLTLSVVHGVTTLTRNTAFIDKSFNGSTGVIIAWLIYAAFDSLDSSSSLANSYFYLLGFFPISWTLAPVMFIFVMISFSPPNAATSALTGFFSGYLFFTGIIQVLPTIYWTICMGLNAVLLFLTVVVNTNTQDQLPNRGVNLSNETFEVPQFGHLIELHSSQLPLADSLSSSSSSSSGTVGARYGSTQSRLDEENIGGGLLDDDESKHGTAAVVDEHESLLPRHYGDGSSSNSSSVGGVGGGAGGSISSKAAGTLKQLFAGMVGGSGRTTASSSASPARHIQMPTLAGLEGKTYQSLPTVPDDPGDDEFHENVRGSGRGGGGGGADSTLFNGSRRRNRMTASPRAGPSRYVIEDDDEDEEYKA